MKSNIPSSQRAHVLTPLSSVSPPPNLCYPPPPLRDDQGRDFQHLFSGLYGLHASGG